MELFNSKRGEEKLVGIAIVILIVYGLFFYNGGVASSPASSVGNTAAASSSVAPTNTVQIVGAPCTIATTLTSSVVRRYTDVAQTGQNVTLYVTTPISNGANGYTFVGASPVLKGTFAHGGTTTVQSGPNAQLIDAYIAFDKSTTFYVRHLRGKFDTCTGAGSTGDTVFQPVAASEDLGDNVILGKEIDQNYLPNKVLQMDTTSNSNLFSIVNDGQANQNNGFGGGGGNLTIGTGSSGSVTVTFRPGYNLAIGPRGNVLACQFPQAVYLADAPISVSIDGVGVLADTPTKPSTSNYPLINANNTVRAFALPGIDGRATPVQTWHMTFRASANNNPQNNGLDSINCTIFDSNYYTRQRDGKVVLDIENRDTNDNLGLGGTGAVVNTNPDSSFVVAVA